MSEREEDKLTDIESALRGLAPRASHIERDRLMFLAGQVSVRAASPEKPRRQWAWPSATAVMTFVSATLAFLLWRAEQAGPLIVEKPENHRAIVAKEPGRVGPERVIASPSNVEIGPTRPGSLRIDSALTHGIDSLADLSMYALPSGSAVSSQRPQSQRELLDNLLEEPARPVIQPSSFLIELFRLSGENS